MNNNQKNIIVSGFGGQGVLFLGTCISAAAIKENKNTTWIPSYGAEMRGGSANCFVIVSDGEIASPIFDHADWGIFLSKQALLKFEHQMKKNGEIFANSSMTGELKTRDDIVYDFVPYNEIILNSNQDLLLNIVALGHFIKKTGILSKDNVIEALCEISSNKNPKLKDVNIKSFEIGYQL